MQGPVAHGIFFSDRKRKLFKITESMFYFASLRNMYVYGQGVE